MSDQTANAGSNDQTDANAGDKGQQQQNGNNDKDNGDNLDDLWQDPQDKEGEKTVEPQQQQQQQQDDPNKVFDEHIKKLNLANGVNLDEISNELNQGNTESLNKALGTLASNVYRQAMIDTSKIIDKKVQEGVDKAIKQSTNAVQGNMAVDKMQATLQFTKNPAINPVATAVLSQLIKKGKSVDEAIAGVKVFFKQTATISAKELGLRNPPRDRPGGKQFNPSNIMTDDDDEEIDWMDTLNI